MFHLVGELHNILSADPARQPGPDDFGFLPRLQSHNWRRADTTWQADEADGELRRGIPGKPSGVTSEASDGDLGPGLPIPIPRARLKSKRPPPLPHEATGQALQLQGMVQLAL